MQEIYKSEVVQSSPSFEWIGYTRLDKKDVVCKLEGNTLEETSYVKQTTPNVHQRV